MSQNVTPVRGFSFGDSFGGPVPARRDRGPRAAVRHAVYTGVQMLEIRPKTAT